MRFVEPKVFLIGKSQLNYPEARAWLDSVGANEFSMSVNAMKDLESATTFAERLVQLAGKRCYMSFQVGLNPNIKQIREDMSDFITNILKVGHGSVLEHVVYNFAIENVSRVFTGEMNRHRAGMAISEGSMRFIRYSDIPIVDVPSIKLTDAEEADHDAVVELCTENYRTLKSLAAKKMATRDVIQKIVEQIEGSYADLQDIWHDELAPESNFKDKKHVTSMLRRIIPMGVATGGVWSGNLRALRHVFTMRCSDAAEEEILHVGSIMLEKMIESEPNFFGDFYKDENGFWTPKFKKI